MATEDFSGTLGNWTQWNPAWGNASISGGQLDFPGGEDCGIWWSGAGSFSDGHYSQVVISGATWLNQYAGVGVRMSGQSGTRNGYFARFYDDAATNKTIALIKYVNGTPSTLATTTYATGSSFTLRLEVDSGTNAVLRTYVGATQVTALNYTDSSSPLTTGIFGIIGRDSTLGVDDWEGGDLAAAAAGSLKRKLLLGVG